MSSPVTSLNTSPIDELISFTTEENPEAPLDETLPVEPVVRDLDNSTEDTCNSKFPKDLPPRIRQNPLSQHKHALVTISDMETSPRARWHLNHRSIKAADLADMTIAFSERTPETMIPLQLYAWGRFQVQEVYNIERGEYSDMYVLRKFGGMFCDFFFFGSMTKFLRLSILKEVDSVFGGRCVENVYMIGQAPGNLDLERTRCIIEIEFSSEPNRKVRLAQYLSSLLHQMVHVYMYLFSCRVRKCHAKYMHIGSDHGAAFQDIACAVEKGARIFGLDLDLKRQLSFAAELASLLPRISSITDDNLEYWDFDRKRLRKQRNGFLMNFKAIPKCWTFHLYHEKKLDKPDM